jgi:hypothetical protein
MKIKKPQGRMDIKMDIPPGVLFSETGSTGPRSTSRTGETPNTPIIGG